MDKVEARFVGIEVAPIEPEPEPELPDPRDGAIGLALSDTRYRTRLDTGDLYRIAEHDGLVKLNDEGHVSNAAEVVDQLVAAHPALFRFDSGVSGSGDGGEGCMSIKVERPPGELMNKAIFTLARERLKGR